MVTLRRTPDFHPSAGDRDLLHVAWSLGWATPGAIGGLGSPGSTGSSVDRRLFRLRQQGMLRPMDLPQGPRRHRTLLAVSRRAREVDPGLAGGWRPPPAAAWHSVDVGLALLAATDPALAPGLRVESWQGEAELRAWVRQGQPYPDARVSWATAAGRGRWWVEVDRGTEGRAAWRRKLARYGELRAGDWVLAVTTGDVRSRHLAGLAVESAVPLVACTLAAFRAGGDPEVYVSPVRQRARLSEAMRGNA
jgi:hypothetical protein